MAANTQPETLVDLQTRQVLQSHERLVLSDQYFDDFYAACMEDSKPSEELLEAARITDALGIS